MKQKLLRILPFVTTVLIMALIFFLSSQTAEESSALSSGIAGKIIDFFMAGASEAEKNECLKLFHHIIRKCAHFTLYAALGFSASGMFTGSRRMWAYSTLLCLIYAISDELHQMCVEGRGPLISDVVIDTAGGAVGAAVFLMFFFIFKYRKE